MKPADSENNIAVQEPNMPPKPTTDATACLGNMSETIVNRLAAQPAWAAVASPMSSVASQTLEARAANITGTTHNAQTSIATLRLALTDQPRRSRCDDNQPPPMLPTQVMV